MQLRTFNNEIRSMDLNSPVPSLLDQAIHRMAIQLWTANQKDGKIAQFRQLYSITRRQMRTLNIPTALAKKVARATFRVGFQIQDLHLVFSEIAEEVKYLESWNRRLCWSVDGFFVDKAKTALLLAKDVGMNLRLRYRVACDYCMEDLMDSLWEEMNDEERTLELNAPLSGQDCTSMLTTFWTYLKRGKKDLLLELIVKSHFYAVEEYGYYVAVLNGNEVAMGYFWPRLNYYQQAKDMSRPFRGDQQCRSGLTSFVMAQMDRNQLMNLVAEYASAVLVSLVFCGRLDMVSKAVPLCLSHLTEEEFSDLLRVMVFYGSFSYQLFNDLWQAASSEVRRKFVVDPYFVVISFCNIVTFGDEDILQMVLRETACINQEPLFDKLLSSPALSLTIQNGNWPVLELLAHGLVTSDGQIRPLISRLKSICDEIRAQDPVVVEEYEREVKPTILLRLEEKLSHTRGIVSWFFAIIRNLFL